MRSQLNLLMLLTATAIVALGQSTQATVYYWDANGGTAGTGGVGIWNTVAPPLWRSGSDTGSLTTWPTTGTDNDAYFGGAAGAVTIAAGGVTANDLTFATGGYTVTGNALTLNGTTSTVTVATGTSSIGSKISGSANLTKAGSGTLTLGGANDYTGITTVSAGVLRITDGAALGATAGGTTVANKAQLELSGGITVGDDLSITGGGVSGYILGALYSVSGNNTWTGNITTSTAVVGSTRITVLAGSTLTISGNVNVLNTLSGNSLQSSGTLVISGNITGGETTLPAGESTIYIGSGGGTHHGKTILSGNNTYGGMTGIGAGTLLLTRAAALPQSGAVVASVVRTADKPVLAVRAGGAGEWTASEIDSLLAKATFTTYNSAYLPTFGIEVTSGSAFTYNTPITNTGGAKNLVKLGGGTLTLGGASSYTGTTTVSAGVLKITNGSALGATGGPTNVSNGARLELSGGITVGDVLTITGAGGGSTLGALYSVGGNNTWTGNITTNSTAGAGNTRITVSAGSTLTISGNVDVLNTHYGNSLQSSGTLMISGNITGGGSIPSGLSTLYIGSGGGTHHGMTIFSGANTYGGITDVGAGTLLLTRAAALSRYNQPGAVVVSVVRTADKPVLAVRAGGAGEWIASEVDSLLANATFTTDQTHLPTFGIEVTPGNTFTYDTAITSAGGAKNLVKLGGGTLTLGGASSYTGTTSVSAGVLRITNDSALGATAGGTDVRNDARLELSGGITVSDALSITGRGSGSTATLGALYSVGGNNTWTGDITTTSTDGVGNTRITVLVGSTLTISGNVDVTNKHYGNSLQSSGTLVISGNITGGGSIPSGLSTLYIGSGGGVHHGKTIFSGDNTYSGITEVGAGTLLLTRAAALSRYDQPGAVVASVVRTADKPVLAVRAGGAGEWTDSEIDSLLANATFTTDQTHLPTFGIEVTSGNTFTYDTAITSAGGAKNLVKLGGGTLALGGAGSYTGATTVSEGTLLVNGSIASSSGVALSPGTTLGGSGALSRVTGAGLIGPGNSAGILTAESVDPSSNMAFAFEFTSTGSPNYADSANSVNDVLRLTDPVAPFATALTADNNVSVYFDVQDVIPGDLFQGGFFTDAKADFLATIDDEVASYNYYVSGDGGGTAAAYNGKSYYSLDDWKSWVWVELSTPTVALANFAGGDVINGHVSQFTIVPEPGTLALLAAAFLGLLVGRRRRRNY